MVRQLDLKKPPSIAESIDWARALLLLGADDIDRDVFERTMSIIVKHRTDIDLVAERVGVQLGGAAALERGSGWLSRERCRPASPRASSPSARSCAARASRSAPRSCSTRSRRSGPCPGPNPTDFREALAATIAKSQEDRRVFELLFDRFFFRAAEAEALDREIREDRRYEGGERLDLDQLREAIRQAIAEGSDGEMRDAARLAIAAFGRQGEGSGVVGVDVQRIRRTLGLQAGNRETDADAIQLEREQIQAVRAPPAPRARAGADRAHREDAALAAARRARPGAADQPDPGPRRRPPRGRPAQAAAGDARPRAARAPARVGRRHAADDARLAGDRRRAAAAALPAQAPAAARDLRALRRLHLGHLGERLLPLGPARAARLVSQAAQLRLHRADLRGDRGVRARARLPRDLGARSATRAASPTSRATPTTAASGSSSTRRSPRTSTRARP